MWCKIATAGKVSTLPKVVRDCDRQEFMILTHRGQVPVRAGNIVVCVGQRIWVF